MKRYPTTVVALIVASLFLASSQTLQAKNNWLRQTSAESRKHYRAVQHQETPPGDPFKDDPSPGSKTQKKTESPEEIKFYEEDPEELEEYAESSGQCPMRIIHQGKFFGGVEYLYARPTFSEAVSHVDFTVNGTDRTDNRVEYNFGYESSSRAFVGYELCDCGGAVLFTYTSLTGNSQMNCGPATSTSNCAGQLEINTDAAGETLTSFANVNLNVYDLEFAKTIPIKSYGGCSSCDSCEGEGCSDCGDSCGGCCPLWDITLFAGVRYVDYDLSYGSQAFDTSGAAAEFGTINTSFNGAGPRIGAQIRRYCGPSANVALYVKGNISLLLGDYDTVSTRVTSNTQIQQAFLTRTIPVTEIELGATWNVWESAFLSGGYMFQAWHDLGMSQTIGGNLLSYDDSNILSFDGAFVRGEWRF